MSETGNKYKFQKGNIQILYYEHIDLKHIGLRRKKRQHVKLSLLRTTHVDSRYFILIIVNKFSVLNL